MTETFRNLLRRKLRTFLTILGITAGSLALTVMGALSEQLNALVAGAARYYNTRVVVQSRATAPGHLFGPTLSAEVADAIRQIPGVSAAFPTTHALLQEGEEATASLTFGLPPLLIGVDARRFEYGKERDPIAVVSGRFFKPGERGLAVMGIDLARVRGIRPGDTFTVQERAFEIVGILERTLTVRDNLVFVPLRDAQEMLAASLPPPFNRDPEVLASEVEVFLTDLNQAAAVADVINRQIKGVRAFPPGEIESRFRHTLVIFNLIAISGAVIAAIVGGLCVFNTMVMAVVERSAEIGVKKAIGATNRDVAAEFLREAMVMGAVGGISGLALGALLVVFLNSSWLAQGVVIFLITSRLVVFTLLFTTLLGAGAGLYPALIAARRNPVDVLRAA